MRLLGFLLLLVSAGCVTQATPQQLSVGSQVPQNIQSVEVHLLPMAAGIVKNFDQSKVSPQMLVRSLKSLLEAKRPDWQIFVVDAMTSPAQGDIRVVTEMIEIDGGSAGLRFWIGFNAGATQSTARITIKDKSGGDVASGNISASRMCPIGACTISNETMIEETLRELASEIAEFVVNPTEYQKRHGAK
jgi:hypothetical protein